MYKENWQYCDRPITKSLIGDWWTYKDMNHVCECVLPEILDYFFGSVCGSRFTCCLFSDTMELSNMNDGDCAIWAINFDCTTFTEFVNAFFQTEFVTDEWEFVFHVRKHGEKYTFVRIA